MRTNTETGLITLDEIQSIEDIPLDSVCKGNGNTIAYSKMWIMPDLMARSQLLRP